MIWSFYLWIFCLFHQSSGGRCSRCRVHVVIGNIYTRVSLSRVPGVILCQWRFGNACHWRIQIFPRASSHRLTITLIPDLSSYTNMQGSLKLTVTKSLSKFARYGPRTSHRAFSSLKSNESDKLDQWIASPPLHTLNDSLSVEHLSDLFVTLPTRDGTRKPYQVPQAGTALPYGHHLAFFHARRPEGLLRADGTDEDISPPPPFSKRMWAGGKITWDRNNPLLIGNNTKANSTVSSCSKKGFDKGKPMVFVTQKIEFTQGGKETPSVTEERAHVYFRPDVSSNKQKIFDREVQGIPTTIDFSFSYTPTPVTLFRYSALMFNAHHIHLDKEYCEKEEGYPERLVHGPLTAQMLLEAVTFHFPKAKIHHFEYRATNPLFVNRELTINGSWVDESTVQMWCCDANGVVGMTGRVELQKIGSEA
ncbi:hypothetical protein B0H34DRAFT_319543 [Crassisporium funariophilum]|nr:hypothetical protein B0H34DRAFT_319543 [Crassisporium funariophilum]